MPSAVIRDKTNLLLNPDYPDFGLVVLYTLEPFLLTTLDIQAVVKQ